MPTTAGSLSLKGMRTGKDAFVVKRLRDAGAVMIAKSNMAEFAFSPIETVNSILPGLHAQSVRHAPRHGGIERRLGGRRRRELRARSRSRATPAIRSAGPAAHQALVGLRSTMGLVSRAGVVPLNLAADIAGARDANGRRHRGRAAGDRRRGSERSGDGRRPRPRRRRTTRPSLRADGLKGARLGVLHQAYDTPTLDREVDERVSRRARRAAESGRRGDRSRGGRRPRRAARARRAAAATSSSTT